MLIVGVYSIGLLEFGSALARGRYRRALVAIALVSALHIGSALVFFRSAQHADWPSILPVATAPLPAAALCIAIFLCLRTPPRARRTGWLLFLLPGGTALSLGVALLLHLRPLRTLPGPPSELAVSDLHACGLFAPGQVICIGANWSGQLGVSAADKRDSFVRVPGPTDALHIYATSDYSCALRQGGRVTYWGGDKTMRPPAPDGQLWDVPESAGIVLLTVQPYQLYGVSASGQVLGWPAPPPAAAQGARTVRARANHACATRKQDGRVVCWQGLWSQHSSEVKEISGLRDAVDAAPDHSGGGCALDKSGTIHCWRPDAAAHPLDAMGAGERLPVLEILPVWDRDYALRREDGSVLHLDGGTLRPWPEASPASFFAASGAYLCVRWPGAPPSCDSLSAGPPSRLRPFRLPSTQFPEGWVGR